MAKQFISKKYEVKKEIACGGMGTIYLATDIKLGRDVAIKMLHPQYSGDPAFAQRFLREAWAMAKLDHPNIIRIWSVEEEESSHCIVMEYFPGNDLKHIIRSRGPLPIAEALPLAIQIIQGIAYAHYMGIIHRDIKPANILVDQEGKVKITDFGIAAAFSESSLTMDGTVMGTPEYMAPEQARAELVGSHTDLYSVGILMYELLTGQTPYKGIPAQSLVAKLAFESENPSLHFPPHIPGDLQDLIINVTQKRVEERLKDINEILTILKTNASLSHKLQPDTEETVFISHDRNSTPNISSPTQTVVQSPSFPTKIQQKIPSNDSATPPPSDKEFGDPLEVKPPIPPQTRKVILSAIGILAFLVITVLVISRWTGEDLSPTQILPAEETISQADHQERVTTTIGEMEQTAQTIQATQKTLDQEFTSFSSALQSLYTTIRNKKIPTPYAKAQQWLDKTKVAVAALALNKGEIENAQRVIVQKRQKAAAFSIEQGDELLQQDLSKDQQKHIHDATTTLNKHLQALEVAFTSHLQDTQERLSNLQDVVQQSEPTVLAMKKAPTPPPPDPRAAQLASLKSDTVSLEKEIGAMFKTFETSTQKLTSTLSNLQKEITLIQRDVAANPGNTQNIEGLNDTLRTIQQKAQTAFSQEKAQQQKLTKNFQSVSQSYKRFSSQPLNSSQKSQLTKLDESLKDSEKRLDAFPPDSWNTLRSLSTKVQALLMTTKNKMAQNIQQQQGQAQQIEALDKKSLQLTASIQVFRSQAFKQYQSFTKQITAYTIQIDELEYLETHDALENMTKSIQVSLNELKKEISQYSGAHHQELQNLSGNQTGISKDLKEMTDSPLTPILKKQVSRVLQTLDSNQQELEKLNQMGWKKLQANLNRTFLASNQTKQSITQKKFSTALSPKEDSAATEEALKKILDNFSTAYENRDLLHLQLTTSMSESRTRNLVLMFKSYLTIKTHTKIMSTSETQAKAKIFIDGLMSKDGEDITPNFIIRETAITIPKKDGEWGKIQW